MMQRWRAVVALIVALILAGCNFGDSKDDKTLVPTVGTPVAQVTAPATFTPFPTPLVPATDVQDQPPPTNALVTTPVDTPGSAPVISPQPTYAPPPTFTPAPPLVMPTATPYIVPTATVAPIVTITPAVTPVVAPTDPLQVPPTFTPFMAPTSPTGGSGPTPVALAPAAQVCATCGSLRLRESPGTAGRVVGYLDALTPLDILGRTENSVWVQVITLDGSTGWVAARYLDLTVDLNAYAVTGTPDDAPTTEPQQPAQPVPDDGSPSPGNVISGISYHARQIFLDGKAKGNRADVFAKVGDSITYAAPYLYPFASGYSLGGYSYLSPAVGFFSGPNARGENCYAASPVAAYPGWRSVDVITPGAAHSGLCGGGETPLECEYRTAKPSVALIMLGTNDVADMNMSVAQYRANMERVIQISINAGVIPVLSTIPPFGHPALESKVAGINQTIVALARQYDVPLWDYYNAIIGLPNRGLSSDGVHPSEAPDNLDGYFDADHLKYGFTMRNLTAMQMLYELWRQVLYDGGSGTVPLPTSAPPGQPTQPPATAAPVDPATYSCPGTLPIRLYVGGQGQVTPGLPNKLRSAPQLNASQVGNMPGEAVFTVTGGPVCADGFTWWQVNYNGTVGWTASGNASEYWVQPYP